MTLTTHAIVGAAVASVVPQYPVAAFILAFLSHFAIDAIPHWHYPVSSVHIDQNDFRNSDMPINKDSLFDLVKIGCDALLGVLLSLFLFQSFRQPFQLSILIGAFGGIIPDALQFVYWKFRHEPLTTLQRFHMWIHADTDLDRRTVLGISLQTVLIIASVLLVKGIMTFQ